MTRYSAVRCLCLPLLVATLFAPTLAAQPAKPAVPVFDVVSVKPNNSGSSDSGIDSDNVGVRLENVTLAYALREAYQLFFSGPNSVLGLPPWAAREHFDIEAKVAPEDGEQYRHLSRAQQGEMLQQLFRDRFHMQAHREQRPGKLLVLSVANGGAKLKDAAAGARGDSMQSGHAQLTARHVTSKQLAQFLTSQLKQSVLDETGLAGHYDCDLHWTPDSDANNPDYPWPPLMTAVREQWGLTLTGRKGAVDVVVIDHVEEPTAN